MKNEQIILVDPRDREMGVMDKLAVHRQGLLHRAFSVCVFNARGELLLQKRARRKYHSGGLWANTCCSHPRPGEATLKAAHRRLKEEMGFDTKLREVFNFRYRVAFSNGLVENEYDHVLMGQWDGMPMPDSTEVSAFKWIALSKLSKDVVSRPNLYTYWLKKSLSRIVSMRRNSNVK